MKKICLFILIIFNLQAIPEFNQKVYNEIEKVIIEQSRELNEYIDKSRLSQIQIAFNTSGDFIEQKNQLLKTIESNISSHPKVKIISLSEASNKDNKSAYIVKFDLAEANYKNKFGLKQEFIGISTLDLVQSSTELSVFNTYKPLNISIKIDSLIIIIINFSLFSLSSFFSFITKKHYAYEIMGTSIFFILMFTTYFYVFI